MLATHPIASNYVANLGHSGGNITGGSYRQAGAGSKQAARVPTGKAGADHVLIQVFTHPLRFAQKQPEPLPGRRIGMRDVNRGDENP
jgi:hypothetical protein